MTEELPDYICPKCGICMIDEKIRTGKDYHYCDPEMLVNVKNTIKLRNKIYELENELSHL